MSSPRPLRVIVTAALAIAVVLAGCSRPERRAPPSVSTDTNLVFILIDTLRANHLGCYGSERETSPVIDAMAGSGVRFARVRSQASWTKASMASLWTGAYPVRTGVLRYQHALPEAATMPAEILKEAGFLTAGIWRNGWIANNFGFAQGFDVYYRPTPSRDPEKLQRRNPTAHPLIGTDVDLFESAKQFIETYRDRRFFLYLHYMDVHQYLYDEESALFGANYVDAYDNAIRWVDKNVGMLVEELAQAGVLERTLLVLASDHGEAFMEHGREGHARDVYGEVTTTPLIMRLPSLLPPGAVVKPRVQNVDVWPTILDLLDLPELPGAQGRSLVPLIDAAAGRDAPDADDVTSRPTFAQMDRTWGREKAEPRPIVAVTRGRYRLIHPVTPPGVDQLFDLETDPQEQENLARQQPEQVTRLMADVTTYLAGDSAPWGGAEDVEIDAMRLEQLRALGYLHDPRDDEDDTE